MVAQGRSPEHDKAQGASTAQALASKVTDTERSGVSATFERKKRPKQNNAPGAQ